MVLRISFVVIVLFAIAASVSQARPSGLRRVSAGEPSLTSAPTIAGTALESETLTGSPGGWTGTEPISKSYQWQRCDDLSYRKRVIDDGALNYWRLGDSGGVAKDEVVGPNGGTYYLNGGSAQGQPGAIAVDTDTSVLFQPFDGVGGRVLAGGVNLRYGDYTVEAWVKTPYTDTVQQIWYFGDREPACEPVGDRQH